MTSFNQRLVREWQELGHQVRVLNYTLQYPSWLFPGTSQYTAEPAPEGLEARRVLSTMAPWTWWKAARTIAEWKPDLVLVRYWTPWLATSLGSVMRLLPRQGCKAPRILLADNLVPHEAFPFTGFLNRWVLSATDGLVTMSESVGQQAADFGYHGLRKVLKHPVYDHFGPRLDREEACQRLQLDRGFRYLLFFGLIRSYKGLDLLLRSLASVDFPFWSGPQGRCWKLVIAGEFYENPQPYLKLIDELRLQDRVVLRTKFIPDSQVAAYFSLAEALVLPYRHATQSGVTQAALHFGLPLLVTRVGGLAEVMEGTGAGELCDPDETSLAQALQRFCSSTDYGAYRMAMQHLSESYGWEPFAREVIALAQESSLLRA
jgi:glycosyltransferase involved in cell wall biosynthesis